VVVGKTLASSLVFVKKLLAWRPDLVQVSLWLVIAGGALVRFIGVNFGLPLTVHADEPIVVGGAIDMLERRSFEPDMFQWPNHTGIMATYLAYVFITPLWHGVMADQAIFSLEIGYFHLIARSVTAFFGVLGIVVAYFIGRHVNRLAGLFSAAFVAFFSPYVQHAHYATSDAILTTTVLFMVLAGMLYLNRPTVPMVLLMSLGAALTVMTKYPGLIVTLIIATVVIAAAIRDRRWWKIVGHGALSVVGLLGFLFLLSPVLFTKRSTVTHQLIKESRSEHLGADGLTFPEKLVFYASNYFGATGVIILLLTIAGLVYVIRKRLLIALPLFIGVVFWAALSTLGLHWERWGMPMYVTPLLLGGIGAWAVIDYVHTKYPGRKAVTVPVAVLLGFALLTQVVSSIAVSAGFLRQDVRVIALDDLTERGITADNSSFEGYTPFYPGGYGTVFDQFEEVNGQLVPLDASVQYVVLSSSMYGRFYAEEQYAEEQEFYGLIDEQFDLIAEYGPQSPGISLPLTQFRIMSSLQSIANTAAGATGGPQLRVFEIPASR
jgi:4-amino-4-deoxy-L-arabinose transferase-like glycosyltransferase